MQADRMQAAENSLPARTLSRDWPLSAPRLLAGALVGSALGCAALQLLYPIFVVPPEIAILPDPPPTAAVMKLEAAQYLVDVKNYSIIFGLVGLFLGTACAGFAFAGRHPRRIIATGLLGAIGCVAGIVLCNLVVSRMRSSGGNDLVLVGYALDHLKQSILAQACLWGLTGLGIGIGLARDVKSALTAGVSGLVGGMLSGLLYTTGVAFFLPNVRTYYVFPHAPGEQFAWLAFNACMVGLTIALGTGERSKKTEEQESTTPSITSVAT